METIEVVFDEKPADTLEIRIYEGQDAYFSLYEDEGDNYNYEDGQFSLINFLWNDKEKSLIISERIGNYTNLHVNKTIKLIKVSEDEGKGLEMASQDKKSIQYNGNQLTIKL